MRHLEIEIQIALLRLALLISRDLSTSILQLTYLMPDRFYSMSIDFTFIFQLTNQPVKFHQFANYLFLVTFETKWKTFINFSYFILVNSFSHNNDTLIF